jgi:hypothetical protein
MNAMTVGARHAAGHGRLWRSLATVTLLACGGEAPSPTTDPAVRALQVELLERAAREQAVRDSAFLPGRFVDAAAMAQVTAVDRENTAWLKGHVAVKGWPSRSVVGDRASQAAMLMLQHATHDPVFQQQMLDTLSVALEKGDVDGEAFAQLYDRVQMQAGRKQRYGTQAKLVGERVVFDPIEDSAGVDARRSTVGLGTLAAYRLALDSVYRSGLSSAKTP